MKRLFALPLLLLFAIVWVLMLPALEAAAQTPETPYSPYVGRDFPTNVYFGDTHLHTNLSFDAYADGNTRNGPDEAYRWAKGETLPGEDGVPTRISRPLDFLAVTDHSEYMGLVQGLAEGNELLRAQEAGARWGEMMDNGQGAEVMGEIVSDGIQNIQRLSAPEFERSVWEDIIDAAEAHYEPGRFTTFVGYEYTSTPKGDNLHRVVLFRDGRERVAQVSPFSFYDSLNPEDLWTYLQDYENKTGGRALAIAHNGNVSAGRMFALQTFQGNPMTREYAQKRMRWEPLYEVTQYKGDGETHPYLSPEDEFADFESWDKGNIAMNKAHQDEFFRHEYARSALMLGLSQESAVGANPFKFGMIGATDSHTSFAQSAEDNFLGKYSAKLPSPDRWTGVFPGPVPGAIGQMYEWETSSSGYAGAWATENTREAIWEAMMRKEVYATTGPRMVVRMFGGFDYAESDVSRHDFAAIGYEKGVPMGGDLTEAPEGKAPKFLVSALKDPDGANLDRIQIVKGWLDADGKLHERVYDVAVSDDRPIVNGKAATKVGSTVDLATATYTNSIGDVQLMAWWADPDFDPSVRSFYYARVIEIPTPRWTAFDEVRFGIEMDPEVTRVLQERAYTSPIWYTP